MSRCRAWLPVGMLAVTACELREITYAAAQDIVVAEVILQADSRIQTAYLHRTATATGSARVLGARVFVRDEEFDTEFELLATADSICLTPPPQGPAPAIGVCHAAVVAPDAVRPGAVYSLHVELPDRPPLRGTTHVPGAFAVVQPAAASCRLDPWTPLVLTWTRAEGAWVYVMQARFTGLAAALRAEGEAVPGGVPEPLDLLGLAIGAADTTVLFPAGFGLFDRGDDALHPVLLAIRHGLPANVSAAVAVAAADRNYVNWVRGGSFNPSGTVRVPSITGGGTGVFGSLVTRRVAVHTGPDGPACGDR
jgi:hypothetical protein